MTCIDRYINYHQLDTESNFYVQFPDGYSCLLQFPCVFQWLIALEELILVQSTVNFLIRLETPVESLEDLAKQYKIKSVQNFMIFMYKVSCIHCPICLWTGFPIKDALLLKLLSKFFALFCLYFHHRVVQEIFYFRGTVSFFWETL